VVKAFSIAASFTVLMMALVIAFPEALLNPGPLMKGHRTLENSCFSCHSPFTGASKQCIGCHKPEDIGIRKTDGRLLAEKKNRALFHNAFSAKSCTECHTDHKGRYPKYAKKTFMHDSLSVSLKNNCNACHSDRKPKDGLHGSAGDACASCHSTDRWNNAVIDHALLTASGNQCIACHKKETPSDALHRQVGTGCASCHRTSRWKPATFDHSRSLSATVKSNCIACHADRKQNDTLHRTAGNGCAKCHRTDKWKNATFNHAMIAKSGRECVACHKKKTPNDGLHRQITGTCSTCHSTLRWKPATFDHNRYFRLDRDHQVSCATCHTVPGNYKSYNCMNCHEHSFSKISDEHFEEGIRNFTNCIRCHRSASEHGEGRNRGRGWDD
jgi:hypothetical protein